MIAYHVLAMHLGDTTAYSRRPGWVRRLIRWRNNMLPWFMYDA